MFEFGAKFREGEYRHVGFHQIRLRFDRLRFEI